jgi:DNA-binding NarL/FixJ family response regulator
MDTIRVMLVDDHAMVRTGLATFLATFEDLELVAQAGSGEQALGWLASTGRTSFLWTWLCPVWTV